MTTIFHGIRPAYSEKDGGTELAQALNRRDTGGSLAVPEIIPFARSMAAEGIVLLKNKENTLPIRDNDRVAVFGRCAIDYFTVGYGSGGDIISPYKANLMQGLTDCGVHFLQGLYEIYAAWCEENRPDEGTWGNWPVSHPEMPLTEALVKEAEKEADIAIVVIGRAAGEDRESLLEKGSYYLTDAEVAMLDMVTSAFCRVAVVLDCGNIIDMAWTEKYGDAIGAILYAWQGGMESGNALADVLTGRADPSGRLTDTIAKTYEDIPSAACFGGTVYNNYVEDIYVGYRYFETFRPERVLYPFGFGLSYTNFSIDATAKRYGDHAVVTAKVRNTGAYAGKQVVQVYFSPPQGKLGNPARILAGFNKTPLLQPGEEHTLEIDCNLRLLAPFDDSGITGYANCQVWEAGEYSISFGENVRDARVLMRWTRQETFPVVRLQEAIAVEPGSVFPRMVNRDGQISYEDTPVDTGKCRERILSRLPAPLAPPEKPVMWKQVADGEATVEAFAAQLSRQELDDLAHGEGEMDSSLGAKGNAGALGGVSESLRNRGVPPVITTDGPSGIRLRATCSLLPCGTALASSFNVRGVQALYALIGKEMGLRGSDILLAPGMNIHRNPLCGRNFEYFSEDPLLTGKIASAVVMGVQSAGVSACPKHFACNNQERNRNTNDSRVSARALREIYLKAFEIVVKEAQPHTIMTSYNKVNGVWSHYHYELATSVLRDEWGFDGLVMTDWWMRPAASREFPNITNDANRIRAQVDVLMPGNDAPWGEKNGRTLQASLDDPDGVTLAEAQRTAVNVLRLVLLHTKV